MITATDFEAEIDAAPRGDAEVRFAYADWLDDRGEDGDREMARFQRWMGKTGHHSENYKGDEWFWFGFLTPHPSHITNQSLWSVLSGHAYNSGRAKAYATREAAEQALRTALESVDYDVTW